jgi:hypothetical protein
MTKSIEEDFKEIIKIHNKSIRTYQKELSNKKFKFAHWGIRLNLWRTKRSLRHYEDKLNEYRRSGYV